jgi:hypothetical protein
MKEIIIAKPFFTGFMLALGALTATTLISIVSSVISFIFFR